MDHYHHYNLVRLLLLYVLYLHTNIFQGDEKPDSEKLDEVESDDERTKSPNKFSLVIETADEIEHSNILPNRHSEQSPEGFIEISAESVTKFELPSPIEETTVSEHEGEMAYWGSF